MSDISEKIPPQNLEAEQAALGAMMLELAAIERGLALLHEEDFYREAHRTIFRGIADLYHRQIAVDVISLGTWLRDRDALEMVGGTLYLTTVMGEVPTAAGIEHYATLIRACSRRRQLIHAAGAIIHEAYAGEVDVDVVQERAEQRIYEIGNDGAVKGPRHVSDILRDVFTQIEDAIGSGHDQGLRTRWPAVNTLLAGVRTGQSVMIAARSGMGKTAFGMNLADTWASWGEPGLIFSLEMEECELTTRELLAYTHQVTNECLNDLPWMQENKERTLIELGRAVEKAWNLPVWIDDRTDLSTTEIEATIRRYQRESQRRYGKPLSWVILDFAQLAHPSRTYRTRTEEVGALAYDLKYIPKRHGIRMVSLAQFNRDGKQRATYRPQDDDLGESDKLLWAADLVLSLYRPGYYGEPEVINALLGKERREYIKGLDHEKRKQQLAPLMTLVEVQTLKQRAGRASRRCLLDYDGGHYLFRDARPEQYAAIRGEAVRAPQGENWAERYGD